MKLEFEVHGGQEHLQLGRFLRLQGFSMALLRSVKFLPNGLSVNANRAHTNAPLQVGNKVTVNLPTDVQLVSPEDIPLRVIYCSKHAMVVDKPAGMLMHPTGGHVTGTLAAAFGGWLRKEGMEPRAFRAVGRLDANTSGLVLCAMNAYAAPMLAKSLKKRYIALAEGIIPLGKGSCSEPLAPCEDSLIRQRVSPTGKVAYTDYEILQHCADFSLASVRLRTGRTHQIRAHFAHMGHALLGDTLYGGGEEHILRHALHCAELTFEEPDGKCNFFVSKLPQDMQNLAIISDKIPSEI